MISLHDLVETIVEEGVNKFKKKHLKKLVTVLEGGTSVEINEATSIISFVSGCNDEAKKIELASKTIPQLLNILQFGKNMLDDQQLSSKIYINILMSLLNLSQVQEYASTIHEYKGVPTIAAIYLNDDGQVKIYAAKTLHILSKYPEYRSELEGCVGDLKQIRHFLKTCNKEKEKLKEKKNSNKKLSTSKRIKLSSSKKEKYHRSSPNIKRRTGKNKEIKVRLCFQKDIRIIGIQSNIELENLISIIKREFKLSKTDEVYVKFSYDGDFLTVSKSEDIQLALSQPQPRLYVLNDLQDVPNFDSSTVKGMNNSYNQKTSLVNEEGIKPSEIPTIEFDTTFNQIPFEELDLENGEIIGRGYFGEVRRVNWKGMDVACKTIYRKSFNSRTDVEMYIREVSILSKLRHPRTLFFIGESTNPLSNDKIIVCEYMANGSLFDLLHKEDTSRRNTLLETDLQIINIAYDISLGMNYLHDRDEPIFHRDLNTKNVLLDSNMNGKIADFGLSKDISEGSLSNTLGTVAYMAPEILIHPQNFIKKSDVYSFGVILWELYTGLSPYGNIESYQLSQLIIKKRNIY